MHITVITTTINRPTVLRTYDEAARSSDDLTVDFIVAGDVTSPHDEIRGVLNSLESPAVYLDPSEQVGMAPTLSDLIGWRSIQRRNFALLRALVDGEADVIVTIDDDNEPHGVRYFDHIATHLRTSYRPLRNPGGWLDPGQFLDPPVRTRGFPLGLRGRREYAVPSEDVRRRPSVVAGLWTGDPDIDAIERLVNAPVIERLTTLDPVLLDVGTWAPFNTQNTAYTRELAPLMFVIPGVGRYDDIWMSYVARRIMDAHGRAVVYGHPWVHQDRNDHDLLRDVELELYGYRHTPQLCQVLRDTSLDQHGSVIDQLETCYRALLHAELLPRDSFAACLEWVEVLRREKIT